jgi:aminopeptidase N
MDEGLNTFCQFVAEQEWDANYPSRRGPAANIVYYMKGDKDGIVPVMTNSEQIKQFGANAYAKVATALNILRETVMGRELFDFAFKTYAQRWAFKHPKPEDFFRSMEDASAFDLDWFWKGWFYTTDHVDLSIDDVNWYKLNTRNPEIENPIAKAEAEEENRHITQVYNQGMEKVVETNPEMRDFYNDYDEYEVTEGQIKAYRTFLASLDEEEKELLNADYNFYEIKFSNVGGLVMPLILEFEFTDGSKERQKIPAEIWRYNTEEVSKVFVFEKELKQVVLDPYRETADTEIENNRFPRQYIPSRIDMFKSKKSTRSSRKSDGTNPMQESRKKTGTATE